MASRTITNAASELVPQNRLRRSIIVQNEDASIDVFVKWERPSGLTVSTTDHDHRLAGGAAIALNKNTDGDAQIHERITIIAASGTPRVSFFETEDEPR